MVKAICLGVSPRGSRGKLVPGRLPVNVRRPPYHPRNYIFIWADMTAEEIREKRRAERKQFKMDRAAAIAKAAAEAEAAFAEGREAVPAAIPSGATWKPQQPSEMGEMDELPEEPPEAEDPDQELEPLENVEHLQLTLQEAFFLAWNLDCLIILDPHTVRDAVSVRTDYIYLISLLTE